jgi:RNA polymerase sigma factor (sigma-70 family)
MTAAETALCQKCNKLEATRPGQTCLICFYQPAPKLCRHCRKNKAGAGRGLCGICHRSTEIRDKYAKQAPPARRLTADQQALAVRWRPLAFGLAATRIKKCPRFVCYDDLCGEALYGLCYAASLYDEATSVPFPAYATMVIKHRLTNYINAAVGRWYANALETADNGCPLDVAGPDLADAVAEMEDARARCDAVRAALEPHQFAALFANLGLGRSFEDIGRERGVTRQSVMQTVHRAEKHVRERVVLAL